MRRSLARRTTRAVVACVAVAAVACGSTVQKGREVVAVGDESGGRVSAGDEFGLDGDSAGGAGSDDGATGFGSSDGSGFVSSGRAGGGSRSGSGVTATVEPREAPSSDTPLKIGFVVVDTTGLTAVAPDSEAAHTSSDASAQAARREMEALVSFANATGGVGGRKLEAIPFKISLSDGANRARMEQHCLAATEDADVDVLVDHSLFADENGWACFAAHRTTFVGVVSGTDQAFLRSLNGYVATSWPAADRSTIALVQGLVDVGYFDGAKVGVLIDDTPIGNRILQQHLLPRLKDAGVTPAETAKLNPYDQGAAASQGASAVLQFKSKGVTHVISLVSFYGYLAFTNPADSQGYYPRYGFGDFQGGAAVAAFYGSSTQNRNSVAVSSTPSYVIDEGKDQERSLSSDVKRDEASPGFQRCLDIYTEYTGVDYYRGNSGRSLSYAFYCDHFLLWLDAARKVGASVTPDNWSRGLAQVGTSYPSPIIHSTQFGPNRYDGSSTYRAGVYSTNTSCRCYVAATGWRQM